MTRLLALLALFLAATMPAAADTRAINGFTDIDARGKFQVVVSIGEGFAVEVEGRDAGRVVTRLDGDTLRLTEHWRWFGLGPRLDAVVRVRLPRVGTLMAAHDARLSANELNANELELTVAMGGVIRARGLRADAVTMMVAMGGTIEAAGACENLDVTVAMGGNVAADQLACANVQANAVMGGVIGVQALESLDAQAVMGGAIDVGGQPAERSSRATMGGSIDID